MTELSIKGDQVFQKSIARKVSREKEVQVGTIDGESFQGFISGLDEEILTLTPSRVTTEVVILRYSISWIKETGRTIDTVGLHKKDVERLRQFTHTIRQKAKAVLSEG